MAFVLTTLSMLCSALSASANEGQQVVQRDIEKFIRARLSEGGDSLNNTTIDVPPLGGFRVDPTRYVGALHTEISTRAPEPLQGRAPLAVALYAGERLVKRSVVTPYIRRSESVVVPKRDLRVGTLLSREDFRVVSRDAARLPNGVVRDLSEIQGLRAKRSLRKDQVFRSSQVEGVPVVERGDRVQIVLDSGPLRINAMGQAKESGAIGEWIRVLNVDSRRELSGQVDREGRVHVAF